MSAKVLAIIFLLAVTSGAATSAAGPERPAPSLVARAREFRDLYRAERWDAVRARMAEGARRWWETREGEGRPWRVGPDSRGPWADWDDHFGTEQELVPVFTKAGGTVDRVNNQLDKLDVVTDSAVSMADSADTAVRAVSTAVTTPVKKISALSAAISHGAAAFRSRKDVGEATRVAKEAAARREAELDEELHAAGQKPSPPA